MVGVSCAALWGVLLAAEHPDRVAGAVFIGPAVALAPPLPERTVYSFDEPLDTDEGWAKYNLHHWLRDYRDFLEFFFAKCFTEPHSTKQIEDGIGVGPRDRRPRRSPTTTQGSACRPVSSSPTSARASAARCS